ncbi:ABC transporter ATP-binding protein/permease [Thermoclostridium stercorarium]|uniref:ABC transporter n=1 Tax=Thermoclostridium stercorarium subsp. leptospartum DSM 9219 TaxID=1346611 RepID=A0A1B1YJL2_THEST|nr:ABC transporter ATP-binding protein [Thermoclostridium stercorarium]ANX00957.1 ABC transporter [Thermoclostridium stercorarium subsp. leptospartum DSM 9219]UZQ86563.1 ABC transporter ATP-binding protein/permease [Thermoclostridium stercorarium]
MKKLRILKDFMKGNLFKYFAAVIFSGIAVVFSILSPMVISFTVDSVIGDEPMDLPAWLMKLVSDFGGRDALRGNIWVLGLLFVFLTLMTGVFQYIKNRWFAVSTENATKNIRDALYDHLQHMEYYEHVRSQTGDLTQRCTADVETVRKFMANQVTQVGEILFTVAVTLVVMVRLNVELTLYSLCVVPFIFLASVIFFTKVKKTFLEVEEADSELHATLQENLTGVRVVRAFGRQEYEIEKFNGKNEKYRDKIRELNELMAWYWSMSDLLCMAQAMLVLFISVSWAANGRITLGTVILFITYIRNLIWPIRQLGRVISDMGQALVAFGRIVEILEKPAEPKFTQGLTPEIKGHIVFENVSFRYPDGTNPIRDISFEVKPGQTVGILGPTGCGKSSLVHLLVRLFDYQEGSIKIDGYELKDIDKKWLRSHIGIVLQEPFLFSKTVLENIKLAKPDATMTEVEHAARIAAIHDTIMSFEKGYETLVGERGVTLSGGQVQRVAIARTVLKEHPILIFDDSLSAVDMETDIMIRRALKERAKGVTTFIISHRINTLAEADFIVVMDKGRIVQMGTHEELIRQEGLYSRIWAIQSALGEGLEVNGNE